MRILVIGGGGREHALAWKLAQSPQVERIYCAPGNGGTAALGENVPLAVTDVAGLLAFAQAHEIGLTVVGPDDALAAGVVGHFQAAGRRVFGPSRAGAQASGQFQPSADALGFCAQRSFPLVIKADGLALGKGVIIA